MKGAAVPTPPIIQMCGIIGYTGKRRAVNVLLEGLETLEYRGYDSAGIAVFDSGKQNRITVVKAKGRIDAVKKKLASMPENNSCCGIGHTRWATHGEPSDANAHPQGTERVQIVHNGIIENYQTLKDGLLADGYGFSSATDTEVAALLIDKIYGTEKKPLAAMRRAEGLFRGSFAIGAVFSDYPGEIYAMRRDNPLIIGCGEGENFIASDITAILSYTKKYYLLDEGSIAVISADKVVFYDANGMEYAPEIHEATWDINAAKRGGYNHFMLKEIHEEPSAITATIHPRISGGLPDFSEEGLDENRLRNARRIFIVGCGTAYHAGLIGKYAIEKAARIPVSVEIASEFRYSDPILSSDDVVIAVSQSGETADTLAAVRLANERGAYTVGIVNVVASTIANTVDTVIYTLAGPEIAVASTKAYSIQSALFTVLAIKLALLNGNMTEDCAKEFLVAITEELPAAILKIIDSEEMFAEIAKKIYTKSDVFYIGRGADSYAALEASLKLKEISYIHSEAYAAGELKHGTISLIEEGTPVIALSTVGALREKMISNIREVKARGALVISVTENGANDFAHVSDYVYELPAIREELAPIAMATALQLIAYYTAVSRNCDVDHPRNLAKSVTVE